jgi:PncC family amidohydrolase
MTDQLAAVLLHNLMTLSVVETAAGGNISATIASRPGASQYFVGGVVPYSPLAKRKLFPEYDPSELGGVVSMHHALYLASSARKYFETDVAIAETSIAPPKPVGSRSKKPAGTSFIAVSIRGEAMYGEAFNLDATTDRATFMESLTAQALNYLSACLEDYLSNDGEGRAQDS